MELHGPVHQLQVISFALVNTPKMINSPMIVEKLDLKPFSVVVMILFV
jgi:hypothetical protein